jgi:hypothetical protein
MKSQSHASDTVLVLVMLACGAFLVTTALALLIISYPASAVPTRLVVPDAEIQITAVPTVSHPLATLTTHATNTLVSQEHQAPAEAPLAQSAPIEAREFPTIPGPLVNPSLSLYTGPISVPLEIRIPALRITAPVVGVGLSLTNAMSAPRGSVPDDPMWQTIFWYRGGGIPGDIGTATLAGHYNDMLGRPAVFAYLDELRVGDLIVVRDQRSGTDISFIVTETRTYTETESSDPSILARIFGSSANTGTDTPPPTDGLSHLTLITCGGTWINGTFDLRLVVYAVRASYPF